MKDWKPYSTPDCTFSTWSPVTGNSIWSERPIAEFGNIADYQRKEISIAKYSNIGGHSTELRREAGSAIRAGYSHILRWWQAVNASSALIDGMCDTWYNQREETIPYTHNLAIAHRVHLFERWNERWKMPNKRVYNWAIYERRPPRYEATHLYRNRSQ